MWQPQTAWLRRAIFQLHLWSGIGIGLYVLLVSVTGSVLVYRNELFRAAVRDPIIVTASGPRLTDEQLTRAATRAYPGYAVIHDNEVDLGRLRTRACGHVCDRRGDVVEPGGPKKAKADLSALDGADEADTATAMNGKTSFGFGVLRLLWRSRAGEQFLSERHRIGLHAVRMSR